VSSPCEFVFFRKPVLIAFMTFIIILIIKKIPGRFFVNYHFFMPLTIKKKRFDVGYINKKSRLFCILIEMAHENSSLRYEIKNTS